MGEKEFQFEIIGHRGCEGLAIDNSIEALHKAIEIGIDRVEFDLRVTKDRKIVLFHNPSIHVNGKITRVSNLTRTGLLKHSGKNENLIPLFIDALNACKNKVKIQAEIKDTSIESLFWNDIDSTVFPLKDVHISSFNFSILKKIKALKPEMLPIQLIYLYRGPKVHDKTIKRLKKHGIGSISINKKHVDADQVNKCHREGIRVIAYGLNEINHEKPRLIETYQYLIHEIGLDGFTSAYPNVVKELIDGK